MDNRFFKYLSVLLLGLILGYLIRGFASIPQAAAEPPSAVGSVKSLGREDAPVVMIEYSDFQCPLCRRYSEETLPKIIRDYVDTGKVRYVFKHFPLNIHPQAVGAASASECALEQGKFWEMHKLLFAKQQLWSGQENYLSTFKAWAAELGLDEARFADCLDSDKFLANIEKDYREAVGKSLRGTPSFFINGEPLVGAKDFTAFADLLDRTLAAPLAAN